MSAIDPTLKSAAIQALRMQLTQYGSIPWVEIRRIARLYGLPETTVYGWAIALSKGKNPDVDRRATSRSAVDDRILAAITHFGGLKPAHRYCVAEGIYRKSYSQFCKDFHRDLDPAIRQGLILGSGSTLPMPMLRYPKCGRNQIWVLDHTWSDVRVVDQKGVVHRPWVSILRDKATRVILGIQYSREYVNSGAVISIVCEALLGHTPLPDGSGFVGGRPESIQVDNGAENTADHIVTGLARLGIALLPTTPGQSWENGAAEQIIGYYQAECEAALPGYVRAGKDVSKNMRYVANTYADQDPDDLLSDTELAIRGRAWALEYNTRAGSDGASPLGLWVGYDDDIDLVQMEELRWAMTVADRNYSVTKNGIHFQNREYQAACLAPYIGKGKVVTIRTFPGIKEWIEVWQADTFVGRAFLPNPMPVSEQSRVMAARRKSMQAIKKAERDSLARRQQDAAGHLDEDLNREAQQTGPEAFGVKDAKPVRDRKRKRKRKERTATRSTKRQDAKTAKAAEYATSMFQPLPLTQQPTGPNEEDARP